jgi:hypothetical protein
MKTLFSFIALFFTCLLVNAQPPNVPADKGKTFGAKTTASDAVSVEQLTAIMKSNDGKKTEVKVKGIVTSVCQAMGCWITLQSADGNMMVRMKDHAFFVPLALNGKEVVIDGFAEEKKISVDELKDNAKDAGKPASEVDAITEPKTEITLTAKGVLVL